MAMTNCKECGSEISTKAEACPKCGAKVRRTSVAAWGCLIIVALFAILAAIGAIFGGGSSSSRTSPNTSSATVGAAAEPTAMANQSGSPTSRNLTAAQQNALRSAKSYLEMSGFSRQGLIDQLSSEYGEKFAVGDATVAVDNLDVDWNTQAARSAASYLEMSGFSCQGLIEQLSSPYGEKYTVEQATYGATRAGIC